MLRNVLELFHKNATLFAKGVIQLKASEAIREVIKRKDVSQSVLRDRLGIPKEKSSTLSQRLRQDNMSVDKLNEMLHVLDYKIVIVPREARVSEGGFEIGRVEGSGENEQQAGIRCLNREHNCSEVRNMSIPERILEEARDLPEQQQRQLLDFALFLKMREDRALDSMMDDIISENLPAFEELAK